MLRCRVGAQIQLAGQNMQPSDHENGEGDGLALMGLLVKGYLCCSVTCAACCSIGSLLLLVFGWQCLGGDSCSSSQTFVLLFFGSLPPGIALATYLYLQADSHGWFRPAYVPPGGHWKRRTQRYEREESVAQVREPSPGTRGVEAPAGHIPMPV